MRPGIGLGGFESAAYQQMPVIKVDGLVPLAVARVEIDDRDLASCRAGFQVFIGDLKYHEIVKPTPNARIEGIDLQRP
jgi:hypothetical protein